ncbi:hypothetical protein WJX73_008996 [Symbiochloris irregularis]|uniref:60S ribosomal protein L7a n=1 Tax=Symbiochloris irregularis TaxID=706552 RepID=A0AAW1P7W8_9CHLO
MAPKSKRVAPAPAAMRKTAAAPKQANPLFEKRPKTFGVGGAPPPKHDLHRFVKWPKYVRIQRQRRVLNQRLKVPPALNRFTKALDRNTAQTLFNILMKYRPEDQAAKKERLLKEAQAKSSGSNVDKKKPVVVKYGINHITQLVEAGKAQLVAIAHDVDPIELVVWLPVLCKKMNVPYVIVKGKARLGTVVHKKTATALALTEVPAKFCQGASSVNASEGKGPIEQPYGFQSLGARISGKHSLWNSNWHSNDLWFADNFRISPLRVFDITEADAVFVPICLGIQDVQTQHEFINNLEQYLPLLHQKPHLVVLNHAATTFLQLQSDLITHNNSHLLTMVALNDKHPGLDSSHIISSPYFFHVHWSRGAPELRNAAQFDVSATESMKTHFAVESFAVRLPEREQIYKDCTSRPEYCTHLDFMSKQDHVDVWESMQSAWYNLHPRGDFLNRGLFYDTLLAGCIPVVFTDQYEGTLPFGDLLDYKQLMITIPLNSTNVIDILRAQHTNEGALRRLRYMRKVAHVFQYLVNPVHELIRSAECAVVMMGHASSSGCPGDAIMLSTSALKPPIHAASVLD